MPSPVELWALMGLESQWEHSGTVFIRLSAARRSSFVQLVTPFPPSPCAVQYHPMGAAAQLGPHPALSLAGPREEQSSHSQPHPAADCGS